jgi:hypothetical protein
MPADPDWTGFWPGIVRGIEEARVPVTARQARVPFRRRFAAAGALAAGLAALVVWQAADSPTVVERGSIVDIAGTEHPDGSVMVYSPPEGDMTVIWVFGLDNPGASAI